MINKKEVKDLLDRLQQYDYYVVNEMVELTTEKKRGICQTAVYHNVKLDWNGTAFRFWNGYDADVSAIINSNIEPPEWNENVITLHITNCLKTFSIICHNK